MAFTVSASEANQNFSRLLGRVEAGETVTIKKRGKPIAKLIPTDKDALTDEDARARRIEAGKRMIAYFQTWPIVTTGPWTRDELYDDDFGK